MTCILFMIALPGCYLFEYPADHESRVGEALIAAKPDSLKRWPDSEMLLKAAYSTAIIVDGAKSVSIRDGTLLNIASQGAQARAEVGAATPVTPDGYYVTAKHCVSGDASTPKYLIAFTLKENRIQLEAHELRIVWQSPPEEELDFAIVYAPIKPLDALLLADKGSLRRKSKVASTGWSGFVNLGELDPLHGNAAGVLIKTVEIVRAGEAEPWVVAYHTCPIDSGDSGGPLLNEKGQLIGINSKTMHRPFDELGSRIGLNLARYRPLPDYTALSIIPPERWLTAIIQLDRTERTADAKRERRGGFDSLWKP